MIHSYSTDYQWTNEANLGIFETIKKIDPNLLIRVEYMDTKNIFSPAYLAHFKELLNYKYQHDKPSGIILTDNNALDFYQLYGAQLFPNIPVVATGINHATPDSIPPQISSLIAEQGAHKTTINQALALFPQTTELFVIADESSTGKLLMDETKAALNLLKPKVQLHFLTGLDQQQLMQQLTPLPANSLIYLLPYFRSASGETYAQGEIAHWLAQQVAAPLFVSWNFQLGTGALGGQIISSEKLGILAAESLLALIQGEQVAVFQTSLNSDQATYDYLAMQRWGVELDQLPRNSQVINRPETFYSLHKEVFIPAAVIISVLAVILVLLLLNLAKQRALNENNSQLMLLNKEVIETQKELVTTLGDIIEVRSHETKYHAVRVAKICRLLGEKLKFGEHQLDLFEAASSMHDVGKIGLPESVLHKAGELSPEEQELMRSHTRIGRDLLGNSQRELMVMCRTIAYQHHEHWDGSGYPNGLQGEEISVYARVTTLVDVYDALSSSRSYKEPWPENQVLEYIRQNSGVMFQPSLVELFCLCLTEIRAIRLAHLG